jgi:biotin operon repressor
VMDATQKPLIQDYLQTFCLGRQRAVKADVLALNFCTSRREVNSLIRDLRKNGHLIGSAKEQPYGYYIPISQEEVKDCLDTFRSEVMDMLHTYNQLRRAQRELIDNVNNHQLFPAEFNESGQMEMLLAK